MNLPENFVERTKKVLGDEYELFESKLNTASPTSIRLNTKTGMQTQQLRSVSWCDSGFYLDERPLFTADPLLHAGAYYVQEASSMFLSQAVKQCFPDAERVLDLCAAPGGKSTLLAQYLTDECLLVSNEIVRQRAQILNENITKWGNPNVVVTNNEASDFSRLTHFFDAIVVDAPCSGEGMFRKDPNAVNEWSVENVMNCVVRQRNILSDCWDALKPGGVLVYSTCTYNYEENEENVDWICNELGAERIRLVVDNDNIVATHGGYRFYPHRIEGEGFFMSVLRKQEGICSPAKLKVQQDKNTKKTDCNLLLYRLLQSDAYSYFSIDSKIFAFKTAFLNELLFIRSHFRCLTIGIEMFELKGKDLIPAAQLALSKALDISSCQCVELDYETAISYLKREAICLPDVGIGYLLLTYNGLALGWVKNIGNRCNNLYPQHWRIRMNL